MSRRVSSLRLRQLLAVAFTIALPWLLLRHLAVQEDFFSSLDRLTVRNLCLPVGLAAVALLLSAVRWRVVVHSLGYAITLRRALFVVLAAWPASAFLPSRLADGLRAVMVKDEVPLGRGLGGVLIEKVFDLQSLAWVFLVGCLLSGWMGAAGITALGLAAFWSVFMIGPRTLLHLAAGLPEKIRDAISALVMSADALRRRPMMLLQLCVYSLSGWALAMAIILSLFEATGAEVAPTDVITIWPATVLAGILPITLTGLGTRDTAFLALLGLLGRSPDPAPILAGTLLYPFVTAWLYVIVGAPFALWSLAGLKGQTGLGAVHDDDSDR